MSDLHDDVFAISPDIRYVAAAHGQQVQMRSRPDLHNASSSDSDLYEELLVNPTLLTLATQRGNIDCGGLRYLIVGYGHFHQLVIPSPAGHVSIAFAARRQPGRSPASDLGCDGASRPARSLKAPARQDCRRSAGGRVSRITRRRTRPWCCVLRRVRRATHF